jgi:hypothetical protein
MPALARQSAPRAHDGGPGEIAKGDFRFSYDERGISLLANPRDPFGATLTTPAGGGRGGGRAGGAPGGAATLALTINYRASATGEWTSLPRSPQMNTAADAGRVTYVRGGAPAPLRVTETYQTDGRVLDWTIDLESTAAAGVTVGDLAINIPAAGPTGNSPEQIFERGFLKHQFISGAGSFF